MKHVNFPVKDLVPWKCIFLFNSFVCGVLPSLYSQYFYGSHSSYNSLHLRLNEINLAAYRHFRENFSTVSNEDWIKDDNDYVAKFTEGIIRNRVYYNSKGEFQCAMKSYGAELLNPELNKKVHDNFDGYAIKTVTELSNLDAVVYYIVIENRESVKKLEYLDGKITVTEEYLNGGL